MSVVEANVIEDREYSLAHFCQIWEEAAKVDAPLDKPAKVHLKRAFFFVAACLPDGEVLNTDDLDMAADFMEQGRGEDLVDWEPFPDFVLESFEKARCQLGL